MKSKLHLIIMMFAQFMLCLNGVEAQPEVRYPNPAYLHWEEPCPEGYGYSWCADWGCIVNNLMFVRESDTEYLAPAFPFSSPVEEKHTLYGVAASFYPLNATRSCHEMRSHITLVVSLYRVTAGDMHLQPVKSQMFEIDSGQRADLLLVYKCFDTDEWYEDSVVRVPIYEFYFDSPMMLEEIGDSSHYLISIFTMDTFCMSFGSPGTRFLRPDWPNRDCCHNGYEAKISYWRNIMIDYLYETSTDYYGDLNNCLKRNEKFDENGVPASRLDTTFYANGQGFYPIIKPKGYLDAPQPTTVTEAGGVQLRPNPARTRVTVEADCAIRKVEISDLLGRVIVSRQYYGDSQSSTLDVSWLSQGSYVVRVKTARETVAQKLVIEN